MGFLKREEKIKDGKIKKRKLIFTYTSRPKRKKELSSFSLDCHSNLIVCRLPSFLSTNICYRKDLQVGLIASLPWSFTVLWLRLAHKQDQGSGTHSCNSCFSRSENNLLLSVISWFLPWSFQPSDDFLQRVGSGSPQKVVHENSQWPNSHGLRSLGNLLFVRALSLGSEPFLWTFEPVTISHNAGSAM